MDAKKILRRLVRDKTARKYLIVAAVVVSVLFLAFSQTMLRVLVYFALTALTAVLVFYNYYLRLPVDFTPVFFLSIVIAATYGLVPAVFFLIVAGVIPTMVAGGSMDPGYWVMLIVIVALDYVSIFFVDFGIAYVGIGLVAVYAVLDVAIKIVVGESFAKKILSAAFTLGINAFYFWYFGDVLLKLLA
jgi:energy-converting hydrogenase Eha subunit E